MSFFFLLICLLLFQTNPYFQLKSMSVSQAYQSGQATSMAVYNLPSSADETEVQSIFPSARSVSFVRSHSVSPQSKGCATLTHSYNVSRWYYLRWREVKEGRPKHFRRK
ncbi:hypothetical protein MN116_001632 [Schistosoma mekongi]|uniref:Uncharacterized protein n=1 Tax=Schistosoma mekongi TaxID=38744 RepID=A0AAE1ZIH2_SCHME|nr:hypothetical protein MN116_001632 [Schistosoma mekongi]